MCRPSPPKHRLWHTDAPPPELPARRWVLHPATVSWLGRVMSGSGHLVWGFDVARMSGASFCFGPFRALSLLPAGRRPLTTTTAVPHVHDSKLRSPVETVLSKESAPAGLAAHLTWVRDSLVATEAPMLQSGCLTRMQESEHTPS